MAHVAFVSTMSGEPWGGSEELWSRAAHHLLQRGHKVSASVHGWPTPPKQIQALIDAGCNFQFRAELPPKTFGQRVIKKVMKSPDPPHPNQVWLLEQRPDLLLLSQGMYTEGEQWMWLCHANNIPYAILPEAAAELPWPEDQWNKNFRKYYKDAKGVFFVSKGNQDLVQGQLGTWLPQSKVVFNPFNVSLNADPPWPASAEPVKLAFLGRWHPLVKGQDILFKVLREPKWKARPLQVSLYGSGPYVESMQLMKEMYELDNVELVGFKEDVESIWAKHHALILTSRLEGLPLVVVEAMLCARPCIVTDVAGNSELIEDNVTGFVAAAAGVRPVDEAMERAWARRGEWQAMGKLAQARTRAVVPPDPASVFADELEALLK